MVAAVLFISLVVFIFLNIPISISLGLSSVLALIASGSPLGVIPSMMQATVQKFSLLTIPLFVLAGVLMDKGGISKRLINLADSMMGPVHGGLGYISVICALFFAAISGSGTATVAAMGSILIPAMVKQGYDAGFSSALSAISGSLGTVIPPSITFIIYGMITDLKSILKCTSWILKSGYRTWRNLFRNLYTDRGSSRSSNLQLHCW